MAGEIISEHKDGTITVIAFGRDAPRVTGSFDSYEQYRRLNEETTEITGENDVPEAPVPGIVARTLGRLGIFAVR